MGKDYAHLIACNQTAAAPPELVNVEYSFTIKDRSPPLHIVFEVLG